jgi:hypothetical protein
MIDLDTSSLPHYQLSPHGIIVTCLVLLIRVEVRMIASLYPHMESSVVPPASSHQISRSQILLSLSLVHIEHEK